RAAMSFWWTDPAVSVKGLSSAAGSSRARTKKLAIWARVTGLWGQNLVLSGGLQPFVISEAARPLMSDSWIDPSSSVNEPLPSVLDPTAVAAITVPNKAATAISTTSAFRDRIARHGALFGRENGEGVIAGRPGASRGGR